MINRIFKPLLEALPENNRLERIWVLAKTDFLKRYYGSFLGVMWALLNPLFQLAVYYSVFTLVFNSKQENFALFLFLGLVLEMFYAETSSAGLNVIQSKRHVLENIKIKWIDVYYSTTLSTFFAFLFNFSIYFVISFFMDVTIGPEAGYVVPLLVLNLLLFGFALQLLLSTIQIYLRDIVHLWDMIKMMILWLSGIFYPIDPTPGSDTAALAYLTPLAGIAYNARQVLMYGEEANWSLIAYDLAYTLVLLAVALIVFSKFVRKALEKI